MADESGDRGSGGWDGRDSFGAEASGAGAGRGYNRADISALGLPEDRFASWSTAPPDFEKMDAPARDVYNALRALEINSLTLGGLFSRFGKAALGMNPGPFGLSPWNHPAADQLSFADKALSFIGGPMGKGASMLARGGAEIATGTNADFGGGFGTPGGDPSLGSGGEMAAAPETVSGALGQKPQPGAIEQEVGNLAAKKAMLMRDFQTQDSIAEFRQLLAEVTQLRGQMRAR